MEQCAKMVTAAFGIGKSADDKFLFAMQLQFDPCTASSTGFVT